MAWLFSLSAECGPAKEAAEAFASHFEGFVVSLHDGSRFQCNSSVQHFEDWWACVLPVGVSRSGINNQDDERQLTLIGNALYERLCSAPPFRYAIVGVELEEFRNFSELDNDVAELDFNGLVLSDAVWKHVGSLSSFVPFETGYRWRPFVKAR